MANDEKRIAVHSHARLLDVAVLLLVLLSLVALWQRRNLAYVFEGDHTPRSYSVSFEILGVRRDTALTLEADTMLYAKTEEGTAELGVLTNELTVLPRIREVKGEDGEYRNVLMPIVGDGAFVDAAGTLSCHGVMREGKLMVGELLLAVGEDILVVGEGLELELHVVSLSENH